MKTFEELIEELEVDIDELKDLPEGKKISNEEVDIRVGTFLNGYRIAENSAREQFNNISFQLNRKILKGCQGKKLIRFYNERVGSVLDDFIF